MKILIVGSFEYKIYAPAFANGFKQLGHEVLNYMLNSRDELQNYRKDGRYTIDNLPAERAIRPFTVGRTHCTIAVKRVWRWQ